MEDKTIKSFGKAVLITLIAVIISFFGIGKLLNFVFGYSTVEGLYHLITHALLIGILFTIIFCTLLILDELKKR